jgi:hypothetical protein
MKALLLFLLAVCLWLPAKSQNIGINADGATPNASALLDIDVSGLPAANKRGLLIPRVALTATNVAAPIPAPATSLLVYNTAAAGVPPNNVLPGFYHWNGAAWVAMLSGNPGWTVLGNAGTNPATNFIGTTDAADWVIKTGGSAALNERIRVLAGGQTVLNNTGLGLNTNDVFSVYATGSTNGTTANTAALGLKAVSGYTSSTGIGLYGSNTGNAANSFAIYGIVPATTGTANAIRGEAASVNGVAITGIANTSGGAIPTGTNARGVIGQVNGTLVGTAVGIGVQGIISPSMVIGDSRGVQGLSPSDNGTGVIGFATTAAATAFPSGVYGQAASVSGTGVTGIASSALTTGNPTGVYGQSASTTGFAVDGYNTTATGTGVLGEGNGIAGTYLTGGSGGAFTGTGTGAFSLATTVANGTGLLAVGNNLAAFGSLAAGVGVAGNGQSFGVYGVAASSAVGAAGAPARAGGYFVSGTAPSQAFTYVACYEGGGTPRKVMGNGTVNTVVKNTEDQYVLLSAPEAPENLFEDFGTGRLVEGKAHITLDPTLSRNILVNDLHPLRVFVQLRGDCKGVFVSNETAEGFDVTELQGGSSNAEFFWTVVGNRANQSFPDGTTWPFAEERFARTQGPQPTTAAEPVKVAPKRTAARPVGPATAVGLVP